MTINLADALCGIVASSKDAVTRLLSTHFFHFLTLVGLFALQTLRVKVMYLSSNFPCVVIVFQNSLQLVFHFL